MAFCSGTLLKPNNCFSPTHKPKAPTPYYDSRKKVGEYESYGQFYMSVTTLFIALSDLTI